MFVGAAFRCPPQGIQLDGRRPESGYRILARYRRCDGEASLRVLRKRWNTAKNDECVNAETGQVWWPECSKEAYADGISGAVDA